MAVRRPPRGRFLVLEGLDGAGTTTQTAELVRRLRARGLEASDTAEPSRGPVGSLLRLALSGRLQGAHGQGFDRGALALLFAADRLDHVASEILPRLAEGRWVVSDRYTLSSLAYQTLDLPAPFVTAINARAPVPDLTIFLDVPPEVALRRRRAEGSTADLFERLPLQRRVADGYQRALAAGTGRGPTAVVDGTLTVGAVADEVERLVLRRFRAGREPRRTARS